MDHLAQCTQLAHNTRLFKQRKQKGGNNEKCEKEAAQNEQGSWKGYGSSDKQSGNWSSVSAGPPAASICNSLESLPQRRDFKSLGPVATFQVCP